MNELDKMALHLFQQLSEKDKDLLISLARAKATETKQTTQEATGQSHPSRKTCGTSKGSDAKAHGVVGYARLGLNVSSDTN